MLFAAKKTIRAAQRAIDFRPYQKIPPRCDGILWLSDIVLDGLLIHEALDAAFGGFLKLLIADFYVSNLAVLRKVLIDIFDGRSDEQLDVLISIFGRLKELIIRINERHQFVVAIYDKRLYHLINGVYQILNLLGVDVLSGRAEDHVLVAALDIDISLLIEQSEVART